MESAPTLTTPSLDDVRAVAPALANYTETSIIKGLWSRTDLNPRDRSLVTLAVLISLGQTIGLPNYANRALDSGVTPCEISEAVTHLAFYAGWGKAFAVILGLKDVFALRGIGADQLPAVSPDPLPIDQSAEDKRAAAVQESVGPVSQGLVDYTGELLFHDLWLRPDLAPRDRSLITVSALVATGQVAQITFHLNRAMDNGLTKDEVSGLLAHLAFYAGWPFTMSAVPVVKDVLAKRAS